MHRIGYVGCFFGARLQAFKKRRFHCSMRALLGHVQMQVIADRVYQRDMISRTYDHMNHGRRRVLIQSSPGSGKTVMGADILQSALSRDCPAWFNVHRQELIKQTEGTLKRHGIPYGVIGDGHERTDHLVQIVSVPTATNHLDEFEKRPRLMLWDECRHITSTSWNRIFEWADGAFHVGLDGTPARPDGRSLGKFFDVMVKGPTIPWLIENGYLSNYEYYGPDMPDLSAADLGGSDYDETAAGKIMSGQALMGNVIATWLKRARGMKTVGFAKTVEQSKAYAAAFCAAGIRAVHLDAKTPATARRAAIMDFALGNIDVIWNVGLFGEGFDIAAYAGMDVRIQCVILAAPTKSLPKNKQMTMRCMRPGPDAVILDHCGEWTRHGLPDDVIDWDLENKPQRKPPEGGVLPITQCDKCDRVFRPAPRCPHCSHAREIKDRPLIYMPGEIERIDKERVRAQRVADDLMQAARTKRVKAARTFDELKKLEIEFGYANGWAGMTYKRKNAWKKRR